MRFKALSLLILSVLSKNVWGAIDSATSNTESGSFGPGIMLGEPTGINLKYWTSYSNALNFGLTYSSGNSLAFLGDWLWHFPGAFTSIKHSRFLNELVPYVGLGGLISEVTNSSAALGIRIPVGVEFLPKHPPLGVFLEIAPGMTLLPGIGGFLQADIGIRYYL